ncbi:2-dehydropantoate 2-reductase [Polyangium sp. y55x31]|uniref:ketopantoate reductase family protein n=1 Tax=Polyangium sp. y55x31 TaxID=3042688 RepID=UPI00248254D8|nr:2-dehydropantoate 2-reductase [Polyangium sp. y55x31]MDI1477039.1 2-dehydropantoate 2-reductase [Polyangium sp. y55x31]
MSQDSVSSGARSSGPRFLVVGCGGIGGLVAAHLFAGGHDVTALTTNARIAEAINTKGLRVLGENSPGTVRGRAIAELSPGTEPFDYILLATQPPQVEEAARGVLPFLAETGAMVTFQNGLCEPRLAQIAGPDRVLGGVVAWGASMIEPGVYERTSPGGFVLGRMDGQPDDRLYPLAKALSSIGETIITDNLAGARWSKLAINCAITSLGALGGDRLGALLRHRFIRRLTLEVMTEVVLVARASGVKLQKVSGTLDLDWIALSDADRMAVASPSLFAKHAILLAVGTRFRKMRSSMLAAIERGRPPAVDFLNGEITSRGLSLGVATPINAAIQAEVHALAANRTPPSLALCRALYERTRSLVNAPFSIPPPPAEADPAALDPEIPPPPRKATASRVSPSSLEL